MSMRITGFEIDLETLLMKKYSGVEQSVYSGIDGSSRTFAIGLVQINTPLKKSIGLAYDAPLVRISTSVEKCFKYAEHTKNFLTNDISLQTGCGIHKHDYMSSHGPSTREFRALCNPNKIAEGNRLYTFSLFEEDLKNVLPEIEYMLNLADALKQDTFDCFAIASHGFSSTEATA